MASIVKFKDGWRAFTFAGGRRGPTKTFRLYKDAQAWAKRVEAELAKSSGAHTLGQALKRYADTVSVHKKTNEWEQRRLAEFLAWFGDVPVDKVTPERIAQWRDDRIKTVTGSTIRRQANVLRAVFQVAVNEWRWVERNPFSGVKLPKHSPPRHQKWTWQAIRRVLRHPATGKTAETQAAFRIALAAGLRLSEALKAPQCFDQKTRVITLSDSKTGRSVRPVPRRAVKHMRAVFTVEPNEASVLFGKLCKSAGVQDLTFHDARASALTWLARRVDVLTLSRISGHKDLKQLMTYYRESDADIAKRI